jgi:hypothetical protein
MTPGPDAIAYRAPAAVGMLMQAAAVEVGGQPNCG